MITKPNLLLSLATCVALSACAQMPTSVETSRVDNDALFFYNDPVAQGPVVDQIDALTQSADALVKASRVNGALVGAAVGCGLTALAGANARSCAVSAAVAGAGGAVLGNMRGERDVERRIELIQPNDMARDINVAASRLDGVRTDLPTHLAAQEAELNSLTMQLVRNSIDQDEHDAAVLQIQQDRLALADALTISARDARQAAANLEEAARRGQTGLEWHIKETTEFADDVDSTRLSFDTW